MAKALFTYVRCKLHPEAPLQSWVSHMSGIYSVCSACKQQTGYGAVEGGYAAHYDLFQITLSRNTKESYEDLWNRADITISSDPEKYKVVEFSDLADLVKKRSKRDA